MPLNDPSAISYVALGVTMRRGGPVPHPASTKQILKLRDEGLTWIEIAEQVDMTTLRLAYGQPSLPSWSSAHPG
jgi:hypothetical protein